MILNCYIKDQTQMSLGNQEKIKTVNIHLLKFVFPLKFFHFAARFYKINKLQYFFFSELVKITVV